MFPFWAQFFALPHGPRPDRTTKGPPEQKRTGSFKTGCTPPCSNAGHLASQYLRYVMAGRLAGAWGRFGGMGSMLTNLAHMVEFSVAQNMEIACRYGNLQHATWARRARKRGAVEASKGCPLRINRGEMLQCANDRQAEYDDRTHFQDPAASCRTELLDVMLGRTQSETRRKIDFLGTLPERNRPARWISLERMEPTIGARNEGTGSAAAMQRLAGRRRSARRSGMGGFGGADLQGWARRRSARRFGRAALAPFYQFAAGKGGKLPARVTRASSRGG